MSASGFKKGQFIERTRGEAYHCVQKFDTSKINPKFKLVPPPAHDDSALFQKLLESCRVWLLCTHSKLMQICTIPFM
jgi:hypothetical protein